MDYGSKKTFGKTPKAKVKKDWTFPEAPKCKNCGKDVHLEAVKDAQEWCLMWGEWCDHCNEPTIVEDPCKDLEWPFEDNYVYSADWEALGIRVEIA